MVRVQEMADVALESDQVVESAQAPEMDLVPEPGLPVLEPRILTFLPELTLLIRVQTESFFDLSDGSWFANGISD